MSDDKKDSYDTMGVMPMKASEAAKMNEQDDTHKMGIRGLGSILMERLGWANRLGQQFGGKRNLYNVYGYSRIISFEDYYMRYTRQDIAKRIVNAAADATWKNPPEIEASEAFQTAWKKLVAEHDLWGTLTRADRMAGIGQYAIILLGFSDTGKLESPAKKKEGMELLYMQPYMQCDVTIVELEDDVTNARFGEPRMYEIKLTNPMQNAINMVESAIKKPVAPKTMKVHYTRILHIAEDLKSNNFIGTPRLEAVYNLLDDLLKVSGGTAETYWLTSNRGMQINIDKDAEMLKEDAQALSDEVDEFTNDLRRIIRTRGVEIKNLGANTPDPKNTFNMIISLMAASTGIPQRIMLGAEAGQLASDQDRANWADRIKERRNTFAEPYVLKPLIDSLTLAGILPEEAPEKRDFKWPATFEMTPLESAQMMAQKARAIINLSKHYDSEPLISKEEARDLVGLPDKPVEGTIPARIDTSSGSAGKQGNSAGSDDNTNNGTRQENISEAQGSGG